MHCASLLRTIFPSSARAHERVHVQNVRYFPQTKLDNGINSPFNFLFFQVFAKNSLMKNIFEEEKSLIVEHDLFWKTVSNWVYFGQGEDFKLTTGLSEKVQYSRNQENKNGLKEAILLMPINEALLSRQNFVPFK